MRALAFVASCVVLCSLSACEPEGSIVQGAAGGNGGSGGLGDGGSGGTGGGGGSGGGGDGGSAPITATFTQVKVLFQMSCGTGNCHLNGHNEGKLKLDGSVAYAQLVGVAAKVAPAKLRVVAGDPAASFLMTKITGTVANDGSEGAAMPLIIGQLQPDQIALVKAWIEGGAKDD